MLLKKVCILSVLMSALAFGENIAVNHSEKLVADGKYILKSEKNSITAMSAKNKDGSCDICGRRAQREGDWVLKNKSYRADFHCKNCRNKFYGRVQFKLKYDGLVVKKKHTSHQGA